MTRSRRAEFAYRKERVLRKKEGKADTCPFCSLPDSQIIKTLKKFKIILNRFKYEIWDSSRVIEHLMIVPQRHITSIGEYTQAEKVEYIDIVADYEAKGYSVYSRGNSSHMKSVLHQHTHLIKLDSKRVGLLIFNQKPYFQYFR